MIDKRNVFISNLSRTSRNKSFQLAFFPWQPHFVIKELHWLWKVLELKPSANRDPGARPHEWRPERKAGKTDGANESGGRRPLSLERQGEDKNSPLRQFALPQVESVASSTEVVSSENQEIPGGLSFFLLCEMTLNKSRNLAL